MKLFSLLTLCLFFQLFINSTHAQWQSDLVKIDSIGNLTYYPDSDGFVLPDYSVVGYNGTGILDLPGSVPVVKTISPISGDNTSHIQSALDSVGGLPLSPSGFRGALLLNPGQYDIAGTIKINKSGVVLYGSGNGDNPASNTIIYGTGTDNRTLIEIGGGTEDHLWNAQVSGTVTNITDAVVPVGSKTFTVQDASPFSVGDNIIIYYPFTNALLAAMDHGGTQGASDWDMGYFSDKAIRYNTYITGISGNTITTVSPVFYTLDQSLSQPYIYKFDRSNLVTQVGIENLRVDMNYSGSTDENHPENCIAFKEAENGWAKNCVTLHFIRHGFVTYSSNYITFYNCEALDPISQITGSRRYNFGLEEGSQNILFHSCFSRHGRHSFVSDGQSTTAGMVMYNCSATERHDAAEAHRHWTSGILWDNYLDFGPANHNRSLGLHNRGDWGSTAHGWSSVHATAWNCDVRGDAPDGKITVQQPPTAQNYAIGCFGEIIFDKPFDAPAGYVEGTNVAGLEPPSLYMAQLNARLSVAPDSIAPSVPLNLQANPTAHDEVELNWDASTDNVYVSGYKIFVNGSYWGTSVANAFTVQGLTGSTSYDFQVSAFDPSGNESSLSSVVSATTLSIQYPIVHSISAVPQVEFSGENLYDGSLDDSSRWSAQNYPQWVLIDYGKDSLIHTTKLWTYQDRAYQFKIFGGTNLSDVQAENPSTLLVDRSANSSSLQPITDSFSNTVIRYILIKVTGAYFYTGSWVSLREFEIEGTTLVGDEEIDHHAIAVYPNPAKTELYVQGEFDSYVLYDYLGRELIKGKSSSDLTSISLNGLYNGGYIVQIQTQKETKLFKILKQ